VLYTTVCLPPYYTIIWEYGSVNIVRKGDGEGRGGFRSEFGSDPELPTGAPLQDFAYIRCAMFIEAVHDG